MSDCIRLHNLIEHSFVNGPDSRFVIWTQGCPLHCSGCFNPDTHDVNGGFDMSIGELVDRINNAPDIRGITLTGGEPLMQTKAIGKLLALLDRKLDVLLFSGFTFDEVMASDEKKKIVYQTDASLLGRYDRSKPHSFYGKKLVLNGEKIKKEELKPWFNTEVLIQETNVSITGLYKKVGRSEK